MVATPTRTDPDKASANEGRRSGGDNSPKWHGFGLETDGGLLDRIGQMIKASTRAIRVEAVEKALALPVPAMERNAPSKEVYTGASERRRRRKGRNEGGREKEGRNEILTPSLPSGSPRLLRGEPNGRSFNLPLSRNMGVVEGRVHPGRDPREIRVKGVHPQRPPLQSKGKEGGAGPGKANPPVEDKGRRRTKVRLPHGGTLTALEGARERDLSGAMSIAKAAIALEEMGVPNVRARRTITGTLLLEVPGKGCNEKADQLVARMVEVLRGEKVRVVRPTRRTDVRIGELDDSATVEEIALAGIAREESVIGVMSEWETSGGLPQAWAQCPSAAARKIAGKGRIAVGWISATVEPLRPRPLRCHCCLELGHIRQRCTSERDRGGLCYRCGDAVHHASQCSAVPRCPLCSDAGRPAGHRLGGLGCMPMPPRVDGMDRGHPVPGGRRHTIAPSNNPRGHGLRSELSRGT